MCAVYNDGSLYCVGSNDQGKLGTGDTMDYRRSLQLFWFSRIGATPPMLTWMPSSTSSAGGVLAKRGGSNNG